MYPQKNLDISAPGWWNHIHFWPCKTSWITHRPRIHQDRDWVHGQASTLQVGHKVSSGKWRGRLLWTCARFSLFFNWFKVQSPGLRYRCWLSLCPFLFKKVVKENNNRKGSTFDCSILNFSKLATKTLHSLLAFLFVASVAIYN